MKELSKAIPSPHSPSLSLDSQARDAFFACYVTGKSKTWDFLIQYYHPLDAPDHLKLSIEAASLAYLSHQVSSDIALRTARERYGKALSLAKKALQSPEAASNNTALLSALILDLFEKITNDEPLGQWTAHVKGALALVGIRGLEQFQDPAALRVLVRLSTNLLISCVASETHVPCDLIKLRKHAEKYISLQDDPKWKLTNLMITYANLRANTRCGYLTSEEIIRQSTELDAKLLSLTINMPQSWRYRTTASRSDLAYCCQFDTYPDLYITQTWNVLRLVRLLVNEKITFLSQRQQVPGMSPLSSSTITAKVNTKVLVDEICSSVPQYTDCLGATQSKLSPDGAIRNISLCGVSHSPSRILDCYTLIFPLYVAGRHLRSSIKTKEWIINKLRHTGEHFNIRNAALVSQILQKGEDIDPWLVYAMLGSYAFAA